MKPSQVEMDAPLSPVELNTMANAVECELVGDSSHLLTWLGLLSPTQKTQLWLALSEPDRQALAGLRQQEAV